MRAGRRAALLVLVGAVVAMHGCVATSLGDRLGDLQAARDAPARIDVAYVRELAPEAPPALAPAPAPTVAPAAPAPRAARPPAPAASRAVPEPAPAPAPEPPAAAASEPIPERVAAAPEVLPAPLPVPEAPPMPEVPSAPAAASAPAEVPPAASAPVAEAARVAEAPASAPLASAGPAASGAAGAPPFDWPASTRLTYRLTGYYRGDVAGDAQVEWVKAGTRYQVHLDITIGPSLAPLITRRMTSDGEITPEGLAPRRYDEDTKIVFRDRQRRTMLFDADSVVLANGERRERPAATQDSASQFVQLSYLFTMRPELLKPGNAIEIPLALPRRLERWTYDVLEAETLATPFGELPTYHLRPRREVAKAGGDLLAEIWYAPSLRYLPVRIRIRQDADTYLDMLISRKPELGGP